MIGTKPVGAVTISRDPFARAEVVRTKVGAGSCSWCGTVRRLWQYGTEVDTGHYSAHRGQFCSKSCHDDYHG